MRRGEGGGRLERKGKEGGKEEMEEGWKEKTNGEETGQSKVAKTLNFYKPSLHHPASDSTDDFDHT